MKKKPLMRIRVPGTTLRSGGSYMFTSGNPEMSGLQVVITNNSHRDLEVVQEETKKTLKVTIK